MTWRMSSPASWVVYASLLLRSGALHGAAYAPAVRRGDVRRLVVVAETGDSIGNSMAGQRALVTGASGGIGAAIAVSLGARRCRLILHYNTREAGALETARRVVASGGTVDGIVRADFRSAEAVEGLWEHVDEAWGGIDVLVNNAGQVTKQAASEASFQAWDETMAINLDAPYKLACGAHARMNHGGRIVMVSSVHGTRSVEWMTAYAASKAALNSLTATLGVEWAPDGVRVVGVAPGPVPVERTMSKLNTPESQALWRPHLPLGAMGTVDQIADAVIWLLESPASEWITGQTITLDGGMSGRQNMPIRPRPADNAAVHRTPQQSMIEDSATLLTAPQFYGSTDPTAATNGAEVPRTLNDARDAATIATATYGSSSVEAVEAWAVVSEFESRSERAAFVPTLAEECEVDATTVKCQQLAKDLEELDSLIAAGPDASPLREAARRMLREIEDRHDNSAFRKGK
ncbi:hypothetical protein CTAYLR_005732 [Chrysophaeum taylorii]|uniref:SDR family oxidoreductase n=1 Tax=Chrysophaeum taylorii TaxID=2483200 RepID=A0AAD7UIR3_9STRA|nr:hypothetical protein CTAYLR_005732 [Chrysophaeum taylorii]